MPTSKKHGRVPCDGDFNENNIRIFTTENTKDTKIKNLLYSFVLFVFSVVKK